MTGTYLLDYGAGNVRSLVNAVKKLGHDITFVKDPSDILKADVKKKKKSCADVCCNSSEIFRSPIEDLTTSRYPFLNHF